LIENAKYNAAVENKNSIYAVNENQKVVKSKRSVGRSPQKHKLSRLSVDKSRCLVMGKRDSRLNAAQSQQWQQRGAICAHGKSALETLSPIHRHISRHPVSSRPMYTSFFGLQKEPFSIAPDPRFLFMSERHREALAHLLYGVSGSGGVVVLSGEIGAGKTTVCRCFLEQIPAATWPTSSSPSSRL
jgi:hypothetical protein